MKTKQSILSYVAASLVAAAMISPTTSASARDRVPIQRRSIGIGYLNYVFGRVPSA